MKSFNPVLTVTLLFGLAGFSLLAQNSIDFQVKYNYLHLPVSYEEEKVYKYLPDGPSKRISYEVMWTPPAWRCL